MLGGVILVALSDYNASANARLLALAAALTDAQLDAPTDYGRSLREMLLHLVTLEWINRILIETHVYPAASPPVNGSALVADLRAFAADEGRRLHAYLDAMDEETLATPVVLTRGAATYALAPWEGLLQLLTHSMQHRSEIAAMLTQHGHSPGDVDFIFHRYPQMRP